MTTVLYSVKPEKLIGGRITDVYGIQITDLKLIFGSNQQMWFHSYSVGFVHSVILAQQQ